MPIDFDPAKNSANVLKHGIALSRATDMDVAFIVEDDRRDYGEDRFLAFGEIDGLAYSLAFIVRDDRVRAISLRRAREKELKRYGR